MKPNSVHTEGISVWTVFFVRKLFKCVICMILLFVLISASVLVMESGQLHSSLIRLHVVADSDTAADQNAKLQVRDAVLDYLNTAMQAADVETAKKFLSDHLDELKEIGERTLRLSGIQDPVFISLGKEPFPVRHYDTFSLPSGVYESLRIRIGSGEGENWWCVVFPSLCMGAVSGSFQDCAVSAGFTEPLVNTLAEENGYELRFFFLDCLGKLQNFFYRYG